MNLFIVNRFTGEATDDTKKEEQNKLSNVLNKINKRKKRKVNANTIKHVDNENEFQESELFKTDVDYGINNDKNILKENELSEDEPEVKKTKVNDTSSIAGFSILGTVKFDTKLTVKRVLPKWLKNPIVLSADLQKLNEKISKTDLDKKLKIKLKDNNIKYLFPVQAGFIPWQLTKSKQANVIHCPDVCVSAPTGSGKTLAFMIPLIQHLTEKLKNKNITVKAVRVLLVLPTQSLAMQIYNTFKTYTAETNITIGIITSAETTFKNEQKLLVTDNTIWSSTSRSDVVVCTAGRLIDHLKNTKGFDLQYLEYIVVDEADRVLDSMQDDWLRHLGIHLRSEEEDLIGNNTLTLLSIKKRIDPQKLLFSATLSSDPEKLEKFSLFQPNLFTCVTNNEILIDNTESIERNIGKYTVPKELIEKITVCTLASKPLILYKLIMDIIKSTEKPKILIFVKEIQVAYRLSTLMCFMAKKSFTVKEITDQTPKVKRKEILQSFCGRETNVLICTDIIARGIDIPNVDCVISYNVPTHIKTYIHRAGRTARGGLSGVCITILETHEEKKFITMLETAGINHKPIKKVEYNETDLEKLDTLYKKSLEQLKFKVKNHKRHVLLKTKFKKQVLKTDRKCTKMN